jgi:hypothetical protein
MGEPTANVHINQRRFIEKNEKECAQNSLTESLMEEPARPVHVGLEYETMNGIASASQREKEFGEINMSASSGRQDAKRDVKLALSFVCLVIFGSMNAVGNKLQAIPM